MVPLALRDKLYRSFVLSLGQPAAVFERFVGDIASEFPQDARHLRDRSARFRSVLEEWRRCSATAPMNLLEEIELARLLFARGLYFDTHEFLEAVWKRSDGKLKLRLQGFIQLAAALHKLELDPKARAGARYLVQRGFEKLEGL